MTKYTDEPDELDNFYIVSCQYCDQEFDIAKDEYCEECVCCIKCCKCLASKEVN